MKRIVLFVLLVAAVVAVAQAGRPSTQINYQGVLRDAADVPLDGSYDMVFRFFSADVGGDEILVDTHAGVTVSGGLFNVRLGGISSVADGVVTDGSGPGTYLYLPAVFGDYTDVYLEVEVNGETLAPRTRIVSAAAAMNARYVNGFEVADGPLDLYVDANFGDDGNSGLFPAAAKQTIQAAVNRVPAILGGPVTIHIADGVYREEVFLGNRIILGGWVVFEGNTASPQNVVLDGEGIRDTGILVLGLAEIRGIEARNYLEEGFEVDWGNMWVNHCRVIGNGSVASWGAGIAVYDAAAEVSNTLIANNANLGINLSEGGSKLEIDNCQITGNGTDGIEASDQSLLQVDGPLLIEGNGGVGLVVKENSHANLKGRADLTISGNTGGDMQVSSHSTIHGYGNGSTGSCVATDSYSTCDP